MNKSESIKAIAIALVAVQSKLPKALKDSENPFLHNKYASLATVMPLALAALSEQGIAVTQMAGSNNENGTTLTTMLMHISGEWVSDEQPLLLAKPDSQSQGSAITYARRYGIMSAIGMVADEDDDGSHATSAQKVNTKNPAAQGTGYGRQWSEDFKLLYNQIVKGDDDSEYLTKLREDIRNATLVDAEKTVLLQKLDKKVEALTNG